MGGNSDVARAAAKPVEHREKAFAQISIAIRRIGPLAFNHPHFEAACHRPIGIS